MWIFFFLKAGNFLFFFVDLFCSLGNGNGEEMVRFVYVK